MDLSNNSQLPPSNPFLGSQPAPAQPAPVSNPGNAPPNASPVPVDVRDPSAGISLESLAKRQFMLLLPQQMRGSTALIAGRVFAAVFPGAVPPKDDSESSKKPQVTQRDEASAKGDSGKGEDLVNIQVFKVEEISGQMEQKDQRAEKYQTSPATGKSEKSETGEAQSSNPLQRRNEGESELQVVSNQDSGPVETQSAEKPQAAEMTQEKGGMPRSSGEEKSSQNVSKSESPQVHVAQNAQSKEGEGTSKSHENLQAQGKEKAELPQGGNAADRGGMKVAGPSSEKAENQPQIAQAMVDKPKEAFERVAEKARHTEAVDAVKREDKYQEIAHPAGHRVLEHGRVEHRTDAPAYATQADQNTPAQFLELDMIIPPWLVILFQQQEEKSKIKEERNGGAKAQARDVIEHRLADILFMLLCAAIAGSRSISDYVQFIASREKWFKVILGAGCQAPSKELIWRFLSVLNPDTFQEDLKPWLEEVCGRRSKFKDAAGKPVLPSISVWETPIGLFFGQAKGSDPFQDSLAAQRLLKVFRLDNALIYAKATSVNSSVAQMIQRAGADFIFEVDGESSIVTEIEVLIESAAESKLPSYSLLENYLEGIERTVIEALRMEENAPFFGQKNTTKTALILRISSEIFSSKGNTFKRYECMTSLLTISSELFDLLRVQRPIERKVAWQLNCVLQVVSMESAMQQCAKNMKNLQGFAAKLLQASGPELEEKMQLAAVSNDDLLRAINLTL